MTAREFKPGDVAMVTTRSGREYVGVYTYAPGIDYFWRHLDGAERGTGLTDPDIDARLLVVIDPEDEEGSISRLWAILPSNLVSIDQLQAALREFANPTPPKPEEPTGLGAVVEDADGELWVRSDMDEDFPWTQAMDGFMHHYREIAATRVLSEGVPQ